VWHYHLHVTPRFPGDDLYANLSQRAWMAVEERARLADALRSALGDWSPDA
jgi:histidine triad (HIT) family protein